MKTTSGFLSLLDGISLTDIYRAAARPNHASMHKQPARDEIAHATRFAGPAQVSNALMEAEPAATGTDAGDYLPARAA